MRVLAPERPISTLVEPIIAWRAWTIAGTADGREVRLYPIAGDHRAWPPRRPKVAVCARRADHPVPGFDCTCGIHATHARELLRRTRDPSAIGTVALWGTVVEHELGFRARIGYPQRLRLVCVVCFWRSGGPSRVDVVGLGRGGRMTPLCRTHAELCERIGLRFRRILPAPEVLSALLEAYAVDLLPA